jgi:subtilisin family serine protease
MKPPIFVRTLSNDERERLEHRGLRSKVTFTLPRSQMLLASSRGEHLPQIARNLGCGQQTVRDAIHDFNERGLDALVAKSSRPKRTHGSTTLERFPGSRDIYLLQLPASSGVFETVERMTADGRLLYAEPNFVAQTPEGEARHRAWGVSDVAPSSRDYAASALNLSIAQNISRGEGVTVAVLDTGAQLDHLALADIFEDVKRYDFVGDDTNPSDRRVGADTDGDGLEDDLWGHGTHVAGIVDFVAPAAKIMPLRVLDTEGYGTVFAIAKAV